MQDEASRRETSRLIGEQRAALLAAIAGARGADWEKQTACAPWTVKDVLAHMVEGELNVGRIYRGEVREQGYIDPEEGIAKWRALPGEAVRAALWQHGTAAQRVLDAMTNEVWRAPIKAFGCREIRQLVRLHLFDVAVHGHDLTEALGREAVWGSALPFLVEFVVRAAPPTLTRRGLEPSGTLFVSDGTRGWVIDGSEGSWRVLHGATRNGAPAAIEADPETLVLLTTGRGDRGTLLEGAAISGDRETVDPILGAWLVV
ncbi:MAG: maleylpyruvate isomerase family mycothiol-dependent enzyme [Actinomycetota bacterium]